MQNQFHVVPSFSKAIRVRLFPLHKLCSREHSNSLSDSSETTPRACSKVLVVGGGKFNLSVQLLDQAGQLNYLD